MSATTRAPRPGEVDGVDYRFLTPDEFEALRGAGGLLEAFEVFGHSYGTPRAPVEDHLAAGQDVLLEIDVQGALEARKEFPDHALLVFVKPPSREEQRRRLVARGGRRGRDRAPSRRRGRPRRPKRAGSTSWW